MTSRIVRTVAVAATLFLAASQTYAELQPRVAIIIDDLGYHMAAGQRTIELPGPVVCAILPGTPGAGSLARTAYEAGKEVLLHLPLQAVGHDGPPDRHRGRDRGAGAHLTAVGWARAHAPRFLVRLRRGLARLRGPGLHGVLE